jgi:hypothetical protein
MTQPETVFEKMDQVASGGRVAVRAAAFAVGGRARGGVTLSVVVPEGFGSAQSDGAVSATLLLNPDEGLAIADWLREAFHAVDTVGPGLYDSTGS